MSEQVRPAEAPQKGPWQFTLKQLFIVTTLWAGGCAVAAQFGAGVLVGVLVLSAVVAGLVYGRTRPLMILLVGCGLFSGLVLALFPRVRMAETVGRFPQCTSNLHNIGVALEAYRQEYGCFPPAYVTDDAGRPMHSWRVLILPQMGEPLIYESYNFDEPWDSPNNRKWAEFIPTFYRCPSDDDPTSATNYVVVVGPDTAWPGRESTTDEDFSDGAENTLLLVEVADSGICWTEPRDLHVTQMPLRINPRAGQGISSRHAGGVNVLYADGAVNFLPDGLSSKTLRAMLTRDGAEKVDSSEY